MMLCRPDTVSFKLQVWAVNDTKSMQLNNTSNTAFIVIIIIVITITITVLSFYSVSQKNPDR